MKHRNHWPMWLLPALMLWVGFGPRTAEAQWKAFLQVGMTGSTFVGETNADRTPILRLSGGGGLRYEALNGFELEPGVIYAVKGSSFEGELEGVPIEATSETSYLEFPILLGYRFNREGRWAPRVFAGPVYSAKIDARIQYRAAGTDFEQSETDESVRDTDLAVTLGMDVNHRIRSEMISLGVRTTYGISNVRTIEPKFHNATIGLFASVVF